MGFGRRLVLPTLSEAEGEESETFARPSIEHARWDKRVSSRVAAGCESPARKCRVTGGGTTRVRFSGRHEFRNSLNSYPGGVFWVGMLRLRTRPLSRPRS